MHANNMEEALSLESAIKEMSPSVRTEIMTFVPLVGAHMGEGTLALSWINRTALNSIAVQDLVLEPVLKGWSRPVKLLAYTNNDWI